MLLIYVDEDRFMSALTRIILGHMFFCNKAQLRLVRGRRMKVYLFMASLDIVICYDYVDEDGKA